jgi:hypothetical protein
MSIQVLKAARWLAFAAFMGVGIWLAFWHHNDGLQPSYLVAVGVPWVIYGLLSHLISKHPDR